MICFTAEHHEIVILNYDYNRDAELFEGLALGSRIATVKWKKGAIQPWLMAIAYGMT